MASPRYSGLPGGLGRVVSMSSSVSSSSHRGPGGLVRSLTMSSIMDNESWSPETTRSQFQDQLQEMAMAANIPLSLPRALLSLPSQRVAALNASDKSGAEAFLMSLRPKRVFLGKSSKGFKSDEVLLGLDKAVGNKIASPLIEALLQLAETAGVKDGNFIGAFTTNKKGHAVPTFSYLFAQAEPSFEIWRLFLGRVSQRALDASLASALTTRSADIERIKLLLEYGANPELCQDRILDLMSSGSDHLIETLLLSPLLSSVELLSHCLSKAVSACSVRNTSLLLLRGADGNSGQAEALKLAVTAKLYDLALAIITMTKAPLSSNRLDEAAGIMSSWSQEAQKEFLRLFLLAGASGPRMSRNLMPFITAREQDITSILIDCPAFRHGTFPAPVFFKSAIDSENFKLALEILQGSSNRSFSDFVGTGVHLQLVAQYCLHTHEVNEIISELMTLGVSGDFTSEMLVACCAMEQIQVPNILSLINILISHGGAKVNYSDGRALLLAIQGANAAVISILASAKSTKKILNSAVSYTSSSLPDDDPVKLEIWSILLKAGASGPPVDQELISAIDQTPQAFGKVKTLLKVASLDFLDGKAVIRAVRLERLDILEALFSQRIPQFTTFASIWRQIRKLFALTESPEGNLPYTMVYMQKVFQTLRLAARGATPINELLFDSTQCSTKEVALGLSQLFLRWGATPNHSLGSPLQACIKRSDTKTLTILLTAETSKTSLKYGFVEALQLRKNSRQELLEIIIGAGLEQASLDAALPQVLRENPYPGPIIHQLVEAGATLHSSFGENLIPPATNLDIQTVEKLLHAVGNRDVILLPLETILSSRTDWQSPDGSSLPMVKLLLKSCTKGTWADRAFITAVKARNLHCVQLFARHLTSAGIYSDALRELLLCDTGPLDQQSLSLTQYLLREGGRGSVIDEYFVYAAAALDFGWMCTLYPYISDRSIAISAFDRMMNGQRTTTTLHGNKLEIVQFLLKEGLQGPSVDQHFVEVASAADMKGMSVFIPFVASKTSFSESLDRISQQASLLISNEGLAAAELLIEYGASSFSVANAARIATRNSSLMAVKVITSLSRTSSTIHAAFEGLLDAAQPLKSPESRNILFHLLEIGLDDEDVKQVGHLAASGFDVDIFKALASPKYLLGSAVNTIAALGDAWLSPRGLDFVLFLINSGAPSSALQQLLDTTSKGFHFSAIQMIVSACDDKTQAANFAFNTLVGESQRWASIEGLPIVEYLLKNGAKGSFVENAAAYAAKSSNYDALDVFLKSPVAGAAIAAAFKALTRDKQGRLSSEQLTIASTLVKQGVSTEVLAIASIEMAKILDIEGLKVLSQSPHFLNITDEVLRALLLDEHLWRAPGGRRIAQYLFEKGVSTKGLQVAALKAAAALDIDALRNTLESKSTSIIVEAAIASLTGLQKGWLCPEGLRILELLLPLEPPQAYINTAFIQASQHLHLRSVQLLHPYISELSVFNEALSEAISTGSNWLLSIDLITILLSSGVEGEIVELALVKAARALDLAALELIAPLLESPEVYARAFAAATENQREWRQSLNIIKFLLEHGATGNTVNEAYVSASRALDFPAIKLLNTFVIDVDTHTKAFREATLNESSPSPIYIAILEFLHSDGISGDAVGAALVSAAKALNVAAVDLLSRNATPDMCSKALSAATQNIKEWTTVDGSSIIRILIEHDARGDAVDELFVKSSRLLRLDLVTIVAENIERDNVRCLRLALDAVLESEQPESPLAGQGWLFNPEAFEILRLLVGMGAKSSSADAALVQAAQFGNENAIDILAQVVGNPSTFTDAFNAMKASGTLWVDVEHFSLVTTLLSRGNADVGVHYALIDAIEYVLQGSASEDLPLLLLQHGADVNFDNGKSLQLTTHHARQDLFELLLQQNPSTNSLYTSLQAALSNDIKEDIVFHLLKSVTENETVQAMLDVNYSVEGDFPLLFYCLNSYPNSDRLVQELCKFNANLSATISWDLYENPYGDPTPDLLPPLLVALDKGCSDEVIDALLSFGAQTNYISEVFRATPLMLAAGKGRSSLVSKLIDAGASVIHKDALGRSPLNYAAKNGDIFVLESILKKNPPRNDGSLHEASRELQPNAVKLLIKAGHDIHFPSSRHEGRSPLCELCFACKGLQDPVNLYNTLTELQLAKADPLRKSRGRTALFMALENAKPIPVITALIEVMLWRDLNDPENVYEQGDYFYSPTMYIKKDIIRQPSETSAELLKTLENFSSIDRYYAKERMPQPPHATGMPQRLRDMDHENWIRSSRLEQEEEDFKRKLKQQKEEMENRQIVSQRDHHMQLQQRENMGRQQSASALDTHLLTMKIKDREHVVGMSHQDELFNRRLSEMASENHMKVGIEASQHVTKSGLQQDNRNAKLLYESRTQKQKLGYLSQKQGLQNSGLEAEQQIKLGGLMTEAQIKQQQQMNDLQFRESKSGLDRADLDHKLQHTDDMNLRKLNLNRGLDELEASSKQTRNRLEDENRQSQFQLLYASDERKIQTQGSMDEHDFARNRDLVETQRMRGGIDVDTRRKINKADNDAIGERLYMGQQDRTHKLVSERQMGQIQNENLQQKFFLTRDERDHKLDTEERMGQMQHQILQTQLGAKMEHLQDSNQKELNHQRASDHQKLLALDMQGKISNHHLQNRGFIETATLRAKNNIGLWNVQHKKRQNLDFQSRSNHLDRQRQDHSHALKMQQNSAEEHLIEKRVQGAAQQEYISVQGTRMKQAEDLQYKRIDG